MSKAQVTADALIVGAGWPGAVAARRLAGAGMRVVALEQGGWPDYARANLFEYAEAFDNRARRRTANRILG